MEQQIITGTVVGLDMSLTGTGFCKMSGIDIAIETIATVPKKFKNDLSRLDHIVNEVMRRIPEIIRMVCIEDFFTPQSPMQMGSAIKLAMLGALMRMALYKKGLPFFVISPSQIKKFATGKGTGQKSIVVREVYKRWGVNATDDNQADACVLAHIAAAIGEDADVTIARPAFQVDTIKTIKKDRPRYNITMPMPPGPEFDEE